MIELKKIYKKIITYIVTLITLVGLLLILKNIIIKNQIGTKYILDGDISYSIESKKESIISDDLDKQKLFVSSTINNIISNFNYKFTFDKNINYKYRYKIISYVIAELDDSSIADKEVFRKEQILFDSGYKNGITNYFDINKSVSLNYDYYNNLAKEYNYSVDIPVKSKLLVQLSIFIKLENKEEQEYKYYLSLPLEKSTFSITKSSEQYKGEFLDKKESSANIILNSTIIILLIILLICLVLEFIKIFKYKKENYVEFKYRKIMRDYDNIIAPINVLPKDKDIVSIKVLYFKSMIDIQKELHLPILCYKGKNFIVYIIINNKLAYIYFLNNNKEKI